MCAVMRPHVGPDGKVHARRTVVPTTLKRTRPPSSRYGCHALGDLCILPWSRHRAFGSDPYVDVAVDLVADARLDVQGSDHDHLLHDLPADACPPMLCLLQAAARE